LLLKSASRTPARPAFWIDPRRPLDQNEHQYRNLVRGIALDGLASQIAKIFAAFHIREILAEIIG
jgi:hypothetical protein